MGCHTLPRDPCKACSGKGSVEAQSILYFAECYRAFRKIRCRWFRLLANRYFILRKSLRPPSACAIYAPCNWLLFVVSEADNNKQYCMGKRTNQSRYKSCRTKDGMAGHPEGEDEKEAFFRLRRLSPDSHIVIRYSEVPQGRIIRSFPLHAGLQPIGVRPERLEVHGIEARPWIRVGRVQ